MDTAALKTFALAKPVCGSALLGASLPFPLFATNAAMVLGIYHEIRDIVDNGDSQLKNIPLTMEDALNAYYAFCYLEKLIDDKPSSEFGPERLPKFLTSAEKLCTDYYIPKITAAEAMLKAAEAEWSKLDTRFNFLAQAALKDPHAASALHDEFYPNGEWDPELYDEGKELPKTKTGTSNLMLEKHRRALKENFIKTLGDDLTRNPLFSVRTMLGTPEKMDEQSRLKKTGILNRDRNTRALEAVNAIIKGLNNVLEPKTPQIIPFPTPQKLAPHA